VSQSLAGLLFAETQTAFLEKASPVSSELAVEWTVSVLVSGRLHEPRLANDYSPAGQISCLNLFETEFRQVLAAIIKSDDEHSTSPFPGPVGFPDVAILVCGRVVTQTVAARADRFFDHRARFAHVARNRTRSRKTTS